MHLTVREEHNKKLNEVERCYATIACQFGIVKGVHGKLEHSGMYVLKVLQYSFFFLYFWQHWVGDVWLNSKNSIYDVPSINISVASVVFLWECWVKQHRPCTSSALCCYSCVCDHMSKNWFLFKIIQ